MNTRILLKQLGLKSTLKIRDYMGFRMDEDRDDLGYFNDYIEVKPGDMIYIISFKGK